MWYVYVLYSLGGSKSYVGYTSDVERRMEEHNFIGTKGFTISYRPWALIHYEAYSSKREA
ncbi:MAG: GIY-YIG nuclease family protein, partial [Flavitalea sp.]